jgi:hypothetical protein
VRLKFSDLFEELGYSARCAELSGREVEIAGFIAEAHDGRSQLLVSEPGGCPDCSPEAVSAILLPSFRMKNPNGPVALRGVLSYGFFIDGEGSASFLRLEKARLATGLPT